MKENILKKFYCLIVFIFLPFSCLSDQFLEVFITEEGRLNLYHSDGEIEVDSWDELVEELEIEVEVEVVVFFPKAEISMKALYFQFAQILPDFLEGKKLRVLRVAVATGGAPGGNALYSAENDPYRDSNFRSKVKNRVDF
jgi:hypothetical protein